MRLITKPHCCVTRETRTNWMLEIVVHILSGWTPERIASYVRCKIKEPTVVTFDFIEKGSI